jgi:RNA polymerase subunit RPABC4/transcription elongation factor Spt4
MTNDKETKLDDSSKLDPGHNKTRKVLRIAGPILLVIGFLLFATIILGFIGIPLIFAGAVMTIYGYMGKVARYTAGEMAPVGKDTFNYVATGSKEGISAVASAIGEGLKEGGVSLGGESKESVRCHKCNSVQDADAKFCDDCGTALLKSKPCPGCAELNDADAKFCDNCGQSIA